MFVVVVAVVFLSLVLLHSLGEIVKLVYLNSVMRDWKRMIDIAGEAIGEGDYNKAQAYHSYADYYGANFKRRMYTPWYKPSAWYNERGV